jgi:hypothetical protein
LCEWAEHRFKLNKLDKDGISEREHLEQVERQTGRRPEALEPPTDFPMLLGHVWSAFLTLSNRRTMGFSGPNPVTFEQIKAWKELTETPIDTWEIQAIIRLDQVYMGVYNG